MPKIIIDARESGTSTGRYIDKLIENLYLLVGEQRLNTDYNLTILAKKHRLDNLRNTAPSFTVLETQYKEFTFGEQLGFKKQIESLGPDLVHFGMVQQPVWYKGNTVTTMHDLTTLRFRNPAKNPLIFTLKQQIYKWVNKRVAIKSSQIIVPSEFVKQDILNYTQATADKITVTHESADKITYPAKTFPAAEGEQFLLYVGRPQPHKNLKRLTDAYSLVKQTQPNLRLVLVGKLDAAYIQLKEYAKKQGINGIIFTDWVTEGQLRWLYENATAYVFPSLSEGFGLPALEALHYDLPVISSNATCLPEVLGQAAVYFEPLDTQDIAAKISLVLNDTTLRSNLVKKGPKQLNHYSWQKMAEQTLAVYAKALNKQQ